MLAGSDIKLSSKIALQMLTYVSHSKSDRPNR